MVFPLAGSTANGSFVSSCGVGSTLRRPLRRRRDRSGRSCRCGSNRSARCPPSTGSCGWRSRRRWCSRRRRHPQSLRSPVQVLAPPPKSVGSKTIEGPGRVVADEDHARERAGVALRGQGERVSRDVRQQRLVGDAPPRSVDLHVDNAAVVVGQQKMAVERPVEVACGVLGDAVGGAVEASSDRGWRTFRACR